jgi:catechol 2,3-dioxygenase-like lactoylglutathione lyase family enzyme
VAPQTPIGITTRKDNIMIRRFALPALLIVVTTTLLSAQQAPRLRANRVIVRVTNLDASIAFYRDRVGLALQSTFDNEFALFGEGDMSILLQKVTRKSTGASTGLSALTEIALESPDVLESYRAMKGRGVEFPHAPRVATSEDARDLYTADFRDPDGHILSVVGWVSRR